MDDKELEKGEDGCTWLWKTCCLEQMKKAFEMTEKKGSGIEAHQYNWCFTRDAGGITLAGRARSIVRRGGLIYSQLYGMIKEQYDAAKYYPWDNGDQTLLMMALDRDYKEALRSVVGAKEIDLDSCRASFNHCGRRIMLGVRVNDERSNGIREEHRMSLNLAMAVNAEIIARGEPAIREKGTIDAFYVHWTQHVNMFTESIVLPYARWYQEILGMSKEGELGVDHQKLAVLVSLLLKNSYGSALLAQYPTLWEKKSQGMAGEECELLGLGLKRIIKEYGFGWLNPDLFNFRSNNFAPGIADHFPFPLHVLQQRYVARRQSQGIMMKMLQDVDLVLGRLKQIDEDCSGDEEVKWKFWISWLAMRVMRQYHQDGWERTYESPYDFRGKKLQRKKEKKENRNAEMEEEEGESSNEQSETIGSRKRKKTGKERPERKKSKGVKKDFKDPRLFIYSEVRRELREPPVATGKGSIWTTRELLFALLFYPDTVDVDVKDASAQGWQDLPYLHGMQRIRHELRSKVKFRNTFRQALRQLFDRYCLCIPSVSRDRWPAGDKTKKKPGWIGFNRKGDRINRADELLDSSWEINNRIDQDWCWDLPAERAVMDESIREAKWRRKDHGSWSIYERFDGVEVVYK